MTKTMTTNKTKKTTVDKATTKKTTSAKKTTTKKTINKKNNTKKIVDKVNLKVTFSLLVVFGILFIFSSYAWFSTNLNVKIRTFNMVVTKNSGLEISFDGINYDTSIELTYDTLIEELRQTYPNHKNQWAENGLIPVSSNGISNPNSYFFEMYASKGGIRYLNRDKKKPFMEAVLIDEDNESEFNYYLAFDVFFKNSTSSPISDNLHLESGTEITVDNVSDVEMLGLFNSLRIGFVKVGHAPLEADPAVIQNLECQNDCESIIYEPNSLSHTDLSIERAEKYGVTLVDGEYFTTYGCVEEGGIIFLNNAVSGSPDLNLDIFQPQKTYQEDIFDRPLFPIPRGVTKARVYLWIEGQDIDSLETNSKGAELSISLNFIKDTEGNRDFE